MYPLRYRHRFTCTYRRFSFNRINNTMLCYKSQGFFRVLLWIMMVMIIVMVFMMMVVMVFRGLLG